jgi:hypothetical protein
VALEFRYWLPPYRVKQSGITTIIGWIWPVAVRRSSRSGRDSSNAESFRKKLPRPVKPLSR